MDNITHIDRLSAACKKKDNIMFFIIYIAAMLFNIISFNISAEFGGVKVFSRPSFSHVGQGTCPRVSVPAFPRFRFIV